MNIFNYKAYLFDFDGTIADLEQLNYNSLRAAFKNIANYELSQNSYLEHIAGAGSLAGIKRILDINELSGYDPHAIQAEYRKYKVMELKYNIGNSVVLKPGIIQFLGELRARNKFVGLATSSTIRAVSFVFNHFDMYKYFNCLVSSDHVEKLKPAPDIFLEAQRLSGFGIDQCIGFEDSRNGILSLKNAKIFCVGIIKKGFNDNSVKLADHVIKDYRELIN